MDIIDMETPLELKRFNSSTYTKLKQSLLNKENILITNFGKTYLMASIALEILSQGKSILFVDSLSNTDLTRVAYAYNQPIVFFTSNSNLPVLIENKVKKYKPDYIFIDHIDFRPITSVVKNKRLYKEGVIASLTHWPETIDSYYSHRTNKDITTFLEHDDIVNYISNFDLNIVSYYSSVFMDKIYNIRGKIKLVSDNNTITILTSDKEYFRKVKYGTI